MTLATTQSPGESVIAAEPSYITPEQMLLLPDDGRLYELVDGQLVEKQMSDLAQLIANTLNEQLVLWTARTAAGKSFVEATFQCFPFRPQMVRRPDVAFISTERMSGYQWGQGNFRISPDLAVEVVSPNDNVYNLDRKIGDYFRAGVRRVWVVNPDQQIIRIHRAIGDVSELAGDTELTDESVLPGFHCPLATIFARPATPAAR
jgi:Uma2 family endonuclease